MSHMIMHFEQRLLTEEDGYAVFYPDDGYMTRIGNLRESREHRDNLIREYPDAFVVRVKIERVDDNG